MKKILLVSLLLSTASAFAMDNVIENIPAPEPDRMSAQGRTFYERIQYFLNAAPDSIPAQGDIDGLIHAYTTLNRIEALQERSILQSYFTALLQNKHEVRNAFANRIVERFGVDTDIRGMMTNNHGEPVTVGNMLWLMALQFKHVDELENLLRMNARSNVSTIPLLAKAVTDVATNILPDNGVQAVLDFTNRQEEKRQALGMLLNAGVHIKSFMTEDNRFYAHASTNPELLAFLIIYLQKEQRLQELYDLRDRNNISLVENMREQPNAYPARIAELLNNPEQAATLYPDVERAVQASIDDKPRQARLKYGPKGSW